MNQMTYVIAVYVIGIVGTAGLLMFSVTSMRRAEKRLEELRRK